jgi:4-amino-4-deoxy-L-arabinose transferase-like glycosyltransferase
MNVTGSSEAVERRRERLVLAGLLVGAAFLRLAYLWWYARQLPFAQFPFGDSEIYLDWARRIAAGDLVGPGVFYRAPLYAYVLALFLKLVPGGLMAVYLVQMALGLGTLLLVYASARRIAGRSAAQAALVVAALVGSLPFFETKLLAASWVVFLVTLGTWLVFGSAAKATWSRFCAGLAFGAGVLAWPGAGLAVLAVVGFELRDGRKALRWVALIVAGCAVAVMPATIHNLMVGRDFVPVSGNGGFTFYQGNNRLAAGTMAHPPEVYGTGSGGRYSTGIAGQDRFEREYAERAAGRSLRQSEVSGFWFGRGLRWMAGNPGRALILFGRKLGLLLVNYESPSNYDYEVELETVWPLRLFVMRFGLLLALAVIGFIVAGRRLWGPVSAPILGTTAALLMFYVSSRYRVLMVPALAVAGGIGLAGLYARAQRGRWFLPLAAGLATLFLSALILELPLRRGSDLLRANGFRNLGEVWLRRAQDSSRAATVLERAVLVQQQCLDPRSRQEAVALAETRELLQATRVRDGSDFRVLIGKSGQILARGDTAEALVLLERALAGDSGIKQAYLQLGTIHGRQGRPAAARRVFETGARRFPDDPVLLYNVAVAALDQGDSGAAVAAARRVLGLVPGHPWAAEIVRRAGSR